MSVLSLLKSKIVRGLLALFAIFLVVAYFLTRRKGIATTAVSVVEAQHAPRISALQQQLDDLNHDLGKNQDAVAAALKEVSDRKSALNDTYNRVGLSSDEIAARFNALGI